MTMREKVIENEARSMAEAVNGGDWDKDYTDAQKEGWRLKIKWALVRYEVKIGDLFLLYGHGDHETGFLKGTGSDL